METFEKELENKSVPFLRFFAVLAVEQYFVVHAENQPLSSSEWTLHEIQGMADHHRWSAHELRSTGETVWPEALVGMLMDAGVFEPAA